MTRSQSSSSAVRKAASAVFPQRTWVVYAMPACSAVTTMSARTVSLWAMILCTTSVHAVTSDMPAMIGGVSTIKMDNSAPVSAASAMAYLTGASLHD